MHNTARISSSLLVADVNDFLSPSQACVLPLDGGAIPAKEPEGSVLAPIVSQASSQPNVDTKATITLSDCLSCSGCVTSAETVLLSTASIDLLRHVRLDVSAAKRSTHYAIVALSQQSVASLAVRHGLSLEACARKLAHFLRTALHFDGVADLSRARQLALAEAAAEFLRRHRDGRGPVVCSACPGWLTYAEKTLDDALLDCVSTVRSPQAVFASWTRAAHAAPLWVATVMPCHDKKIEASRPEYALEDGREVDCVLTTGELQTLLDENGYNLVDGAEHDLLGGFSVNDGAFGTATGSGSGGYADYVLRVAARELLNVEIDEATPLQWVKASRSGDMRSVTVEGDGKTLRFACAYGFRSLQSLLRKMRRGECAYDYIELMACPGGCNNGGGQLPLEETNLGEAKAVKAANAALLKKVDAMYMTAPAVTLEQGERSVNELYDSVVEDGVGSARAVELLHTKVVSRKSNLVTPSSLAW